MLENKEKNLVEEYIDLCKQVDEASNKEKELKRQKDFKLQEIVEYMEENDLDRTASFAGLGSITYVKPELQPTYTKEFESDVFDFLRQKGLGDVIKPTVHASTFKTLIRGMVEDGEEVPEYINTTFYKKKLKVNKA